MLSEMVDGDLKLMVSYRFISSCFDDLDYIIITI